VVSYLAQSRLTTLAVRAPSWNVASASADLTFVSGLSLLRPLFLVCEFPIASV
jgi:hypothetical protein